MAKNELKAGVILSYVNMLVGNLIPFIYTPIMLDILGQAEHGLYGIANSVMGYISLLNFGIGSAIIRYISKYRAEGDKKGEAKVIGLFLKTYIVISVLILTVGMILSFNLDFYGRSLTSAELNTLEILVRLMTVSMAVFLPAGIFSSVILSYEKYIFNRIIGIASTVLAPCLNLIMLVLGFKSIGLVIASMIMNLLSCVIYIIYAFARLHISIDLKNTPKGLLSEILCFSAFAFVGSIVDMLYWSTDKLIIGWAIGTSAVTVYNMGAQFNSYLTNLSTAISGVLTPRISAIATKENSIGELSELFIRIGRLQFIIVSFIVSAFIAFGRQFIFLWLGDGYEPAYYVALFTMIPVSVPLIQNTGLNILYVLNKHKFRSIVYACVACLNVVLTFILVWEYGIVGAACATGVSYTLGNIFIINWYYCKRIGLDIPLFWKNILKMCGVPLLCGAVAWGVIDFVGIANWIAFFIMAVVYTLIFALIAYLFMMNEYERDLFCGFIKRIAKVKKVNDEG